MYSLAPCAFGSWLHWLLRCIQILLFIDEMHVLMNAGRGGVDAANMLKPALARGKLHCIGATTLKECVSQGRASVRASLCCVCLCVQPLPIR